MSDLIIIRKILMRFIIIALLMTHIAFAEETVTTNNYMADLDYIDDIYKYDLDVPSETVKPQEIIGKHNDAIENVLMLSLMQRFDDGTFQSEKLVSLEEFKKIMDKLSYGIDTADEQVPLGKFTTFGKAVQSMVSALGYDIYVEKNGGGIAGSLIVAENIKLLNGLKADVQKAISRGELAQLINNTLDTEVFEQISFGDNTDYQKQNGKTFLNERLKMFKLSGVLTAIPSVNIYSNSLPNKDEIEIDRVPYKIAKMSGRGFLNLLGNRVIGYAKYNENDDVLELIALKKDNESKSIIVSLEDIFSVTAQTVEYFTNSKTKQSKASISAINKVLYNGRCAKDLSKLNDVLEQEGVLRLFDTDKDGKIDLAMLDVYQSFLVDKVDIRNKKIYFKYNRQFNGSNSILTDEISTKKLDIVDQNGAAVTLEKIKRNYVVSIAISDDYSYTKMVVSDKVIHATVEEQENDCPVFESTVYKIAQSYSDALKEHNKDSKQIGIGMAGDFYISANNYIAGFGDAMSKYLFGFVKGVNSKSILNQYQMKVFDQNGEWQTLNFAQNIKVDEVDKCKPGEAISRLSEYGINRMVRFGLNDENEVTMIDTLLTTPQELNSIDCMRQDVTWTGTIDWTLGYNLKPSSYRVSDKTVIFKIPSDKTVEEDYQIIKNTAFFDGQKLSLDLYNTNSMFDVKLAVYSGNVTPSVDGNMIIINNVSKAIYGSDESECWKITGLRSVSLGPGKGEMKPVDFYTTTKVFKDNSGLKSGDVIQFTLTDKNLIDYIVLKASIDNIPADYLVNPGDMGEEACGIVLEINAADAMILMDINGQKRSYMLRGIAIYEVQNKKAYNAKIEEINVGDKVLLIGKYRHPYATVVFRN